MFGIGGWEMVLIGVVALLVFGPKRLPELARSLGRGLAEFRRASSDLRRSLDVDLDGTLVSAPDPATQPPAQAGSPATEGEEAPADAPSPGPAASEPAGDSGHEEYEPPARSSAAVPAGEPPASEDPTPSGEPRA